MSKQKRRSERKRASSSRKQPDVFIDRSLGGRKVPARLRTSYPDITFIAHDDIFDKDADDQIWLREAGRRRWIVLTKDEKIRRKPGEQRALVEAHARCFCLHPTTGMRAEEMADVLVRSLPRMLQVAESEKRRGGFVKIVDRRGRIRHLFP